MGYLAGVWGPPRSCHECFMSILKLRYRGDFDGFTKGGSGPMCGRRFMIVVTRVAKPDKRVFYGGVVDFPFRPDLASARVTPGLDMAEDIPALRARKVSKPQTETRSGSG